MRMRKTWTRIVEGLELHSWNTSRTNQSNKERNGTMHLRSPNVKRMIPLVCRKGHSVDSLLVSLHIGDFNFEKSTWLRLSLRISSMPDRNKGNSNRRFSTLEHSEQYICQINGIHLFSKVPRSQVKKYLSQSAIGSLVFDSFARFRPLFWANSLFSIHSRLLNSFS